MSINKLLTKQLFHGSDKNLKVLEPLGVDMGLSFQKPKWAIFFWEDFETARLWALFQHIRRNKLATVYYHIPTGKALMDSQLKHALTSIVGQKIYVYEKTLKIGEYRYGSSPEIKEFTTENSIVPDKKTVITITDKMVDDSILFMSKSDIANYLSELANGKFTHRRGRLFSLLTNKDRDQLRHKYHRLIKAGELQYGDDLSKVSIESAPSAKW